MVSNSLTQQMIDDGKKFLSHLDTTDMKIVAAFWLHNSESGDWEYYFGFKNYETVGPIALYKDLQKAFAKLRNELTTITLNRLVVVGLKTPIILALKKIFRSDSLFTTIRVTNTFATGVQIEDAYIYRMR